MLVNTQSESNTIVEWKSIKTSNQLPISNNYYYLC